MWPSFQNVQNSFPVNDLKPWAAGGQKGAAIPSLLRKEMKNQEDKVTCSRPKTISRRSPHLDLPAPSSGLHPLDAGPTRDEGRTHRPGHRMSHLRSSAD